MVISDRDVKFTSKFWKSLFVGLETKINFSTSYDPEIDWKIEQTNQVIEDMLRINILRDPPSGNTTCIWKNLHTIMATRPLPI